MMRKGISCSLLISILLWSTSHLTSQQRSVSGGAREEAYRINNLGVALLEQYDYKRAAETFRRALQVDPKLSLARINLAIALYNASDLEGARAAAEEAIKLAPDAPQPYYILGLIARSQNRTEDAMAAFKRVLAIDPRDVGANVNLGQMLVQQRRYQEAIAAFRAAYDVEPYNTTALYNLATTLLRAGEREEGQQLLQRFQKLRQSGAGTSLGQSYPEQGRYAEAVTSTGLEEGLINLSIPSVAFTEATRTFLRGNGERESLVDLAALFGRRFDRFDRTTLRNIASSLGGGVTLFDFDGDGDLDLLELAPTSQRLYRNDGGRLTDITEASGLAQMPSDSVCIGAVAGDYDNDGKPDLFILRYGQSSLYHNEGNGKFTDVTAKARIPTYQALALTAAFVDVDHDGDLDLVIGGFAAPPTKQGALVFPDDLPLAPNMLLRNDGDGTFSDVSEEAKVKGPTGRVMAIVPTDFDNRRDVDLLMVQYDGPPVLFKNQRDGSFRDVSAETGLSKRRSFVCAAAGDFNKDGFTDFFFGKVDGSGVFAISDGREHFNLVNAPDASAGASVAQFIDYDDDGLLDLLVWTAKGPRLFRNLGNRWEDLSMRVFEHLNASFPTRALASGDLDGDGDDDLVVRGPDGLHVLRNDGGERQGAIRVRLAGKVSNRSGVGAKVEMRAGSLWQKLEFYAATPAPAPSDISFGLGARARADVVRVLWPAGIVQAETEMPTSNDGAMALRALTVTEVDRKPSSCPYLFTWNGERFEFVTDFLGGGEMGYWMGPGQWSVPDPVEYVRIRDDQLRARDGRFEIRITNELEEVLYLDRVQLIAIAHPADLEVFPNEGMTEPPRPYKLHKLRHLRPVRKAVDDHGCDVSDRIARIDRRYPDDFGLLEIRGYAEPHTLTLDLGKVDKRTALVLTGWTDYAFSSDNVAASQRGLSLRPPRLEAKDAHGRWRTVIEDMGIPVGRPQAIVIELGDKLRPGEREVRITTNMRIYWDQILVAEESPATRVSSVRLDPVSAELRWRGFSAAISPDGREPFGYDYDRVSFASPWKLMPGRYTREGDVRALLLKTDDMFVISRSGDEIALSFSAERLPPLPRGWKRTFLLFADGFSKEMDINSASPDQVAPLPFHGMKSYPYAWPEHYPNTEAHRRYLERYNTRVVARAVARL
ncbi:FG-GAP-like repeat-containing protein [Pyrinomonas methylaliphatogenes]|nr:FG-GAP-like repeat-containing protein [Pyrinomonas methylaliphatogenes]